MGNKPSFSIRSRLTLFAGAVAVISLVAGILVVRGHLRLASDLGEQQTRDVARLTASRIADFADETQTLLEGLALRPEIRGLDSVGCQRVVSQMRDVLERYANIFVVDLERRTRCAAVGIRPSGDHVTPNAAWWDLATHPDSTYVVGPPIVGRRTGQRVVVFAVPVVDEVGERVGHVGAAVNVSRFFEILIAADPPQGGIITLARFDGLVVARTEEMDLWVGRMLPDRGLGLQHALAGSGSEVTESAEGVPTAWAYHTTPPIPWTVYVGTPLASIQATAFQGIAPQIALVAALLILPTLFALWLMSHLDRSVGAIVSGARRATQEGEAIPPVAPRELRALADEFNATLAQRDQAQAEQRRARERLLSIFENAVFGIYVSDPDGRVDQANPAVAAMLGFESPDEMLGLPTSVFHGTEGLRENLVALAARGVRSAEVDFVRRDGEPLPVRLTWSRLDRGPEGRWHEVMVEDLSDRRELETQMREAQKLEAVGRLAGGVAHDFNNRLTVISGQAELLLDDLAPDSDHREPVESILHSASRSAELTAQLLAFSRRQVVQPRMLDLRELTLGMRDLLQRLLGTDIELVIQEGDPAWVRADPGQVEQIIMNLCTNARDAMDGSGRIVLGASQRTAGPTGDAPSDAPWGDYAVLSVSDNGHGMDEATRSKIFEPFFTTKPQGKGTGLGLSTVYGIASQSGGFLKVDSWPGRGTEIQIWLPQADPVSTSETGPSAARGGETQGREGQVVLVAEDEAPVRRVVCRILKNAGYTVLEAEDGFHALALAGDHDDEIHLLVTDLLMPGLEGTELAERLTASRPRLRVLYISGFAEELPELDERTAGVRDFLAKPFTQADLRGRVKALLDGEVPAKA